MNEMGNKVFVDCPPLPAGYRVYPPQVNIYSEAAERHAALTPHAPAIVWDEGRLSYSELKAAVDRAAAGYVKLGLKREDALLLRSPNLATYCISALAAMKLGAIAVMTNSLLKEDDLEFILGNSEARIAAAPSSLAEPLRRLKHPESLLTLSFWTTVRQRVMEKLRFRGLRGREPQSPKPR